MSDLTPPSDLLDRLRKGDRFLIATHVNPDGDAIGSALALAFALEAIGKTVTVLDKHTIPDQYRFLPGWERIRTFEDLEAAGLNPADAGTIILVDCNEPDRIGLEKKEQPLYLQTFKKAIADGLPSIVIDHHETFRPFGDSKWIVPEAAATGLMLLHLIKALGVPLSRGIAINLYAAIAIDTGNFRYPNSTAPVFRAAAELIEAGAIPHGIYGELYESWSDGRFELYMKVIATLDRRGDIVFTHVTQKMFEETGTSVDDTETFVSFPRVLRNVRLSVFLSERRDGEYKVSLRSKGGFNVSAVAEYFGGGGHKNAAGCRIKADLETAKTLLIERIRALQQS